MATASINASDVSRARSLLERYGAWINKYRGGMPAGWMASIMLHESGGNFTSSGDASLGEVGFFQVAAYVPPLFGLPAAARNDPESNVAIAALEYAYEAVNWRLAFPEAVKLGTADSWKLARLSFAVGPGGSRQLGRAAQAWLGGRLTPGNVYGDIVRFVQAGGAPALGSQSADKVAKRTLDIERQWEVGRALGGYPGPPTIIPAPPAGAYTLPAAVAPYFVKPVSTLAIALLGGLAVMYYLWRQRT